MSTALRLPEEILVSRTLRQILGTGPRKVWSVGPADSLLSALKIMAREHIGFLVVLDGTRLAGVLSERDCVRRIATSDGPIDTISVGDVMTRNVVTIDPSHRFADCLRLMHQHRIRHLPVVEGGKIEAVISVRDLLGEAVAYHAKIIEQLERERLTMTTSTA